MSQGDAAPPSSRRRRTTRRWRRALLALPALGIAIATGLTLPAGTLTAGAAPARTQVAPTRAVPAVAQSATHPSILKAGAKLPSGAWLSSPDGQYQLAMQTDGNLVIYWEGHALWASNTDGHAGAWATMQGDGNFVVYQGTKPLWATGTSRAGNRAYYLYVQNDGNVVVYSPTNWPMWASYTALGPELAEGESGEPVRVLQIHLSALGYWLDDPAGYFGDSTEQAVWALQKAAGLSTDGVVGPATVTAIENGVRPTPRPASGYLVEVDLSDDLLMVVDNGKLLYTLNTSTGGGYTYYDNGVAAVADTPEGVFSVYAQVDGMVTDSLGQLWMPKYFYEGFAIHGDSYVPPFPVSHGCVRVSNEAIDWIWAANIIPLGTEVWVY